MTFWKVLFGVCTAIWGVMSVITGEEHAQVMTAIFAVGVGLLSALSEKRGEP